MKKENLFIFIIHSCLTLDLSVCLFGHKNLIPFSNSVFLQLLRTAAVVTCHSHEDNRSSASVIFHLRTVPPCTQILVVALFCGIIAN